MPGLYLYSSNRLEVLAGGLARILKHPLTSPLAPEIIIVQSRGMERWLTLQLADHLGVLANCRFPFPNALLQDLFSVLLDTKEDQSFAKEHLCFRIMDLLGRTRHQQEFVALRQYLADDGEGLKRYALARNLADSFDQYLIFRPRMVMAWEQGRTRYDQDADAAGLEAWQSRLWRMLAAPSAPHRAALARALLETLGRPGPIAGLPERITVFGISYLPPLFMDIFEALARHTAVHLFLMNPCREYWADLKSLRAQERTTTDGMPLADLHLEEGNALLAGLGAQGRYLVDRVCQIEEIETWDDFRENDAPTMLARIQDDILTLNRPREPRPVAPDDVSLQLHACHSPMREVEVLHDHLLDLFQNHSDLKPEDILVMAPAIETYAPYIEAVFGYPGDERLRIPFSIADRPADKQPAIAIVLTLLEIAQARFQVDAVVGLLDLPAVRMRFGITAEDLPLVRDWLARTRIRWAYDGADKAALGLPPEPANTWRAGLDRMLLGYCLPGDAALPWCGILPYPEIEGEHAALLGRLCAFVDGLHAFVASCAVARPPSEWAALLIRACDTFCDPDLAQGRRELLAALDRLAAVPFDDGISLAVTKAWLEDRFRYPSERGFLSGGVTCCSLLPMRSIPFRVICLLGLDNDAFPRRQTRKGFDLMTIKPERGDRSRRDDDRYLFLEALVSARQVLYLSYVGQDQQDNSMLPPSVLVSELLDYLDKNFIMSTTGQGATVSAAITRVHRLHGFSPAYFTGQGLLFSYAASQARTAAVLERGRPGQTRRLVTADLGGDLSSWHEITIETLVRFFEHPVRFFLRERLGLSLPGEQAEMENREVFQLKELARYQAAECIIDARLNGMDPLPILAAQGMLPHGKAGRAAFEHIDASLSGLVERIRYSTGGTPCKHALDVQLGDFHITGEVERYEKGGLIYRGGKIRAKDVAGLWLRHVALNLRQPATSLALGYDFSKGVVTGIRFKPVDGEPILAGLLDLFVQGLVRPLELYPETSYAFVKARAKDEDGLREARKKWNGSDNGGEGADAFYHFHPGEAGPFGPGFEQTAMAFFEPLLKASEDAV